MSGVFARKIANIDKHKWRIIASGGSRILDSELNVTNVLLSIYLSYTPDDIKDFASQILKNETTNDHGRTETICQSREFPAEYVKRDGKPCNSQIKSPGKHTAHGPNNYDKLNTVQQRAAIQPDNQNGCQRIPVRITQTRRVENHFGKQ